MAPTRQPKLTVVLTTIGSKAQAQRLAKVLLKAKVAACINLISPCESFYWWKNKIEKGKEVLLIIKTSQKQLKNLQKLLKANHPYDLPELISLPIQWGDSGYLNWLQASLK